MSNNLNSKNNSPKILENPFVGSLIVPIAIVLVGALVIFGVTKMISSDRNYRDLVFELQSKSFGNKWVAAYELSKQINSKQIPSEDMPWLIKNLDEAYDASADNRTKSFLVAALGALQSPEIIPTIEKALLEKDADIKFQAVLAISNLPKGTAFNFEQLFLIIQAPTEKSELGLKQAAIFTLASHKVSASQPIIVSQLNDSNRLVRYSAATALINFQDESALLTLKEILTLPYPKTGSKLNDGELDYQQISQLKLGVMLALEKNNWNRLNDIVLDVSQKDENTSIAIKAKEVLNMLKK